MLWKSAGWEASAEVFHNYVSNFIYQAWLFDAQGQPVEAVPGNAPYQYQQAAARPVGGELVLNLHPALPWLNWRTGGALVIGLNDNPALRERVGEAARYLPLMPASQARTELRLTAPVRAGRRVSSPYLRLTPDATAAQTRPYAVEGAEMPNPGYALLGADAGTTWRTKAGREAAHFFVQVDNLTNAAYQSHLSRIKYFEYYAASPTGRLGIFNPGRNVGVKVMVPF